jgi:hypothetical protein
MKKAAEAKPSQELRLSNSRWERRLVSKDKRRRKRRRAARKLSLKHEVIAPTPLQRRRRPQRTYLQLPPVLDLVGRYEETTDFIAEMRACAAERPTGVTLTFDAVQEIRPAAMLLLLAEIDRCRRLFSKKRITGTYPESERIERMLEATGFFSLLGVRHRTPELPKTFPLEHIPFMSGQGE